MKSGMKKTSKNSLKPLFRRCLDFLSRPVARAQKAPRIEEQELEIFALLHSSGLPFLKAIELSFASSASIQKQLTRGVSFSSLLQAQNARSVRQLGTLLDYFSLDQAIQYDARLKESRKILVSRLFSKSVYPLFIMAFSSGLTWFFSSAIVPAFGEFQTIDSTLLDLLKLLSGLFWIAVLVLLLFLGQLFLHTDRMTAGFLFRIPAVRQIACLECAVLFQCAQQSALSTAQTLEFMQLSRSFPFASLLASSWSQQLKAGRSLYSCLEQDRRIDPAFLRFFQIGLHGSLIVKMMEAYQKSTLLQLERLMKKLSGWILCFAYGSVGLLAVSVYQIMLAPLGMLESF